MAFGLMWLWMVLIWIGIVVLAVWAAGLLFPRVPSPRGPAHGKSSTDSTAEVKHT